MEQGALGAADVGRVWCGAGLQPACGVQGREHIVRPRAQLILIKNTWRQSQ